MDITEGKILTDSEALLKAKLLGCVVLVFVGEEEKEEESKVCSVAGKAIEITVKLLPKLHQSDGGVVDLYLLFEGDAASEWGETEIEGELCPFAEAEIPIAGSAVAKVKEGSVEQITKLYTFAEDVQLLFQERKDGQFVAGDRLFVMGQEAYVEGNVTVSLTGSHILNNWSII